jgi:hypothetical protein
VAQRAQGAAFAGEPDPYRRRDDEGASDPDGH